MIRQTRRIVVVNSSKLLFPEISPETELSSKSRRSTDRNCANYRHLLVLVIDNESQCSNGYQSRKWVVRMRGLLWLRQLLTTENTSEQNRVPSPVMSLMHKFPSFVPVSPREREREGSFSLNCDLDFQPRARWFLGIGIEVSGIVDAEMHGEMSWINFWHARKVRSRVDFRLRVLNFRRRKLCMKI